MLVVKCPVCGAEGDETDFHAAGQAHVRRPATSDPTNITDEEQRDYLFIRHNPKGLHFERWRCDRGCGKWFHAVRDTMTMEFKAANASLLQALKPGAKVSFEFVERQPGEWVITNVKPMAASTSEGAPAPAAKPHAGH